MDGLLLDTQLSSGDGHCIKLIWPIVRGHVKKCEKLSTYAQHHNVAKQQELFHTILILRGR